MKKFDKDKYLKNLNFKRNLTKYGKYFYIGVPCVLAVVAGIYFAYSKFTVSKDAEVVKTTVGEFIHGDVVIGAYIDGKYSTTIPGKNDGYVVKSVSCDNNATGSWDKDKWGLTLTNMTKRTKCNIYFETKKNSVSDVINEAVNTNSSMFASDDADKNVRYIGANPNNYVYFNCSDYNNQSDSTCEKWRIIGIFNNVTKSDGTKENLVKIIRDESIGNYSWDNKNTSTGAETNYGKNDWTTARLNYLLNPGHDSESVGGSLYYNAKSGTCYYGQNNATTSCNFTSTGLKNDTTRNAIESVVWNLGGTDAYDTSTASMFYTAERGTTVYSGRPTTWTGKIGLMYPSDYGYATTGGSTTNRSTCLSTALFNWDGSGVADCKNNDYLFNSSFQWTLAPYSGDADVVFAVDSLGYVRSSNVNDTTGVRPALYLKSSISVGSGDGTSTSPYKLEM